MKKWMIIAIAIAVIGGIAYYLWQRRKPVEAVAEEDDLFGDIKALLGLLPFREDIYSYNKKNPLALATTDNVYVGTHPTEKGFVEEAKAQAKEAGVPIYIKEGGYYVTEDGKYIKGVGW